MFKLLILQPRHNLADERLQFQVTDRLSFMRFLGLDLAVDVSDTIRCMGDIFLRRIGAARAAVGIGLMNLAYDQLKFL